MCMIELIFTCRPIFNSLIPELGTWAGLFLFFSKMKNAVFFMIHIVKLTGE